MNKVNHTPGPWKVIPPSAEYPSRAMVCGSGANIYNAPLTNETEANASLIAAAPEMYKALKSLAKDYGMEVAAIALKAIYKAEGK